MKKTLAVFLSILMIVITITSGNTLSALAATVTTNEALNDVSNWYAVTSSGGIYGADSGQFLSPVADTQTKGDSTLETIKFIGQNGYTFATKLNVEKNKKYSISFDYYAENFYNWDVKQVAYESVVVSLLKDNGTLAYRRSTTTTPAALSTVCAGGFFKGNYSSGMTYDDATINTAVTTASADHWYSVKFEFDSAENEALQFSINSASIGAGTSTEIANVKLEEVVEEVEVTTNEELNNVNNWYAVTNSGGVYGVGAAWLSPAADTEVKGSTTLNTIKFTGQNGYTFATKLNVEKNKKYSISFDYYAENFYNWDVKQVAYESVVVSLLKDDGKLAYRRSTTTTPAALSTVCAGGFFKGNYSSGMTYDDATINTAVTTASADHWYSVKFEFDSAENEALEFSINSANIGTGTSTEIANVKLEEVVEEEEVEATTNEKLNDVTNWYGITSSNVLYPSTSPTEWFRPNAATQDKGGNEINTISMSNASQYTYATKLNVEKNKKYIISFDYYSENLAGWNANKIVYNTVGIAPLSDGGLIYRTSTTPTTPPALSTVCPGGFFKGAYSSGMAYDDPTINTTVTKSDDNWYSLTFEFDSAENEELEFFLLTGGGSGTIEIANIKLVEDEHIYYSAKTLYENETQKYYNVFGATPYDAENEAFNLPFIGSGFEFVTSGNDLVLNIKSAYLAQYNEYHTDKAAVTKGHTLRFKVWIDGVQQEDVIINERCYYFKKVVFASNMGEGNHTVKIVRASEATVCRNFYVNEVSSNGELIEVTKTNKPYIEVYGDSISSGYGNLSSGEYSDFNDDDANYVYVKDGLIVDPSTEGAQRTLNISEYDFEDGTKTYAYLTAEKIGADIGVFSKSGLGITVYGGKAEEDTETMSRWYPNLPVNKDAEYVIINHITNDIAHYPKAGLTLEGLTDAYVDFITTVRADHENAKIIVAYGMMAIPTTAADSEKVILDAVAKVRASDDEVYAIQLPTGLDGGSGHPTAEQHIAASNTLAEFIKGFDTVKTKPVSTAYNSEAAIRAADTAEGGIKENGLRIYNSISIERFEKGGSKIVEYGSFAIREGFKSQLLPHEGVSEVDLKLAKKYSGYGIGLGVGYRAENTTTDTGNEAINPRIWDTETDLYGGESVVFTSYITGIKAEYYDDEFLVVTYAIDDAGNVYYGDTASVSIFKVAHAIDNDANADELAKAAFDYFVNSTDANKINYSNWCATNSVEVGNLFEPVQNGSEE